jgi:putative iron-regulated protein
MKRALLIATVAGLAMTTACKKDKTTSEPTVDFNTMKQTVLTDFTNKVAIASYKDLSDKADAFYISMQNLNAVPTQSNLENVREQWKDMRSVWEKSEAFLFGPVDENSYDPNMDTWPTDVSQMDSLMLSSNPLTPSDIAQLTLSLRGYHPIEYIIWGQNGDQIASTLTARQKQYMLSLAADLKATCNALYQSWVTGENYGDLVINAGSGSTEYAKKQEVYIALVDGMAGICDEVGAGKMLEPFDAMNAAIVESPYSGNSITDFKNNIIGIQNVYLGNYTEDGTGMNELVAMKDKDLDNRIQQKISEAISSFNNVTMPYGEAIQANGQRPQVQNVMTKLDELKAIMEDELKPFVMQHITD